ncbi:MAG: DUF4236 domain-containing protein [Lachnospiraceae bacterium]|nr:DUF4236 domain-containing protein [Lachnospiraceae bacterium]
MGWFIKKSKTVGPVRFNLSKSGIGVSTGVKGFRVSNGPKGSYLNMGRNGLYYRKKISSPAKSSVVSRNYGPARNTDSYGALSPNDAIRIGGNYSEDDYYSKIIIQKTKAAKVRFTLWMIVSFVTAFFSPIIPFVLMFIGVCLFPYLFAASIRYGLDDNAYMRWTVFLNAFDQLKESKKIWIVEAEQRQANSKYHSGATNSISRSKARINKVRLNKAILFIRTDVSTAVIKSRRCTMLFLPSNVIIQKGLRQYVLSYNQLLILSSTLDYVESERIPKDATVVRYAWKYANIDGSADKRFNNNRQTPVCRYGKVSFSSTSADIKILTSNISSARNVGTAYTQYQAFYRDVIHNKRNVLEEPPCFSQSNTVPPIANAYDSSAANGSDSLLSDMLDNLTERSEQK